MLRSLRPIRIIAQGATIGLVLAAGARAAPTNPDEEHSDLGFTAEMATAHDTNEFRLNDGVPPSSLGIATTRRSDITFTPSLSVDGTLYASRQTLSFLAGVARQDFEYAKTFNQTYKNYLIDWQWQIGNEWDGDASSSLSESLSSFAYVVSSIPNRQDSHTQHVLAQWHPRPDRRLAFRFDQNRGLNSLSAFNILDFRNTTVRTELAADSALGHEIVLGVSQTRTEYPNRVIINFAPIDNSFRQHQVDISTRIAFSGKSGMDLLYGYARRHYPDVPDRDFSGSVGNFALNWEATSHVGLTASITRDLNALDDLFRLYTVTTTAKAGLRHELSSKVVLEGGQNAARADYKGEPNNLYTLFYGHAPERVDKERDSYASLSWVPRDRWKVRFDFTHAVRQSSIPGFPYHDDTVRLDLQYRIGRSL